MNKIYKNSLKRVIDFIVALIGIIILLPVFFILIFILIIINNGKPFFFQKRPGKDERIFKIIKFKTMTDKRDSDGNLLPNEQRLTKFGSFLRKASLDEIPQLINILLGEMSFIGPRPLRVHYLPFYTQQEAKRHTVRPGITGLAQISGRNLLSWEEKLNKDIEYVNNITFWKDTIIFIKTIKKVFLSNNIIMDPDMLDLDELRSESIKETIIKKH